MGNKNTCQVSYTLKLNDDQQQSLLSWITDRLDEMKLDVKFIKEEDPHIIPSLKKLQNILKKDRET